MADQWSSQIAAFRSLAARQRELASADHITRDERDRLRDSADWHDQRAIEREKLIPEIIYEEEADGNSD